MPICEECGDSVQQISFDDFCADCEFNKKVVVTNAMRDLAQRFLYKIEVLEHFPEKEQAFLRHCDECVFGRPDEFNMHMGCLKYHKPRFFQPKDGDFTSGRWGWMRSCLDFKYTKIQEAVRIKELLGNQT
jgi:hypothetical protein